MYQIRRQPTKFPLSQGPFLKKSRQYHDRVMIHRIEQPKNVIDTSTPKNFPRRSIKRTKVERDEKIKRQNYKIGKAIIDARPEKDLLHAGSHVYHQRQRLNAIRASQRHKNELAYGIAWENEKIVKAIESAKSHYGKSSLREHNRFVLYTLINCHLSQFFVLF